MPDHTTVAAVKDFVVAFSILGVAPVLLFSILLINLPLRLAAGLMLWLGLAAAFTSGIIAEKYDL